MLLPVSVVLALGAAIGSGAGPCLLSRTQIRVYKVKNVHARRSDPTCRSETFRFDCQRRRSKLPGALNPVEELTMNRYVQSALVAALGVASVTCALAQENPSPPPDQRDPTSSSATQTPPANGTEPSTVPSRQRQAAAGSSKDTQKQMMKDCVAKEQANNTGVSASQAKKTCKAQMKSNSAPRKNY